MSCHFPNHRRKMEPGQDWSHCSAVTQSCKARDVEMEEIRQGKASTRAGHQGSSCDPQGRDEESRGENPHSRKVTVMLARASPVSSSALSPVARAFPSQPLCPVWASPGAPQTQPGDLGGPGNWAGAAARAPCPDAVTQAHKRCSPGTLQGFSVLKRSRMFYMSQLYLEITPTAGLNYRLNTCTVLF